jgi:hypothetical protein
MLIVTCSKCNTHYCGPCPTCEAAPQQETCKHNTLTRSSVDGVNFFWRCKCGERFSIVPKHITVTNPGPAAPLLDPRNLEGSQDVERD